MQRPTCTMAVLLLFFMGGCAAYKAQNCTENAGYEKGMNDARSNRLMNLGQFATFCDKDSALQAQKGYKEGYQAGSTKGGSQLNLTFKNGRPTLVGAYVCSASINNAHFEERATTESEARDSVLKKCRASNRSCSENNLSCRRD